MCEMLPPYWKFGRVDLLEGLRIGDIRETSSLEMSLILLLVLRLSFIVLARNFFSISHVNF
jgi:hypothetical protein